VLSWRKKFESIDRFWFFDHLSLRKQAAGSILYIPRPRVVRLRVPNSIADGSPIPSFHHWLIESPDS
jgi:hypothetical protein